MINIIYLIYFLLKMNKSLNSKNKYNSPMKHFPKDLSTKRLFSKPKKRRNTCTHLEIRPKEDTNFKKINTKTSLFNPNIKKLIKNGVKNKKNEKSNNNNSNNLSFEEKIIERNIQKKSLKYNSNNYKNGKLHCSLPCSNKNVFDKYIDENRHENEINSKKLKYNDVDQLERKTIIAKNNISNNNKSNELSNMNKNNISFYFNDIIEKIEVGENHSIYNSFIDNNFEKDITINNNKTQENKIENYLLIPCNKCSKMVNIDEIDDHSNNCSKKIEPKITISNNNNERINNNIFDIKDNSYGEMATNSETIECFDLKKMGKILDEKRNFKTEKLDDFINEEKKKRLFLMEILKVKYQKINNNKNLNLIPDILIWKEAKKKNIEKNNWSTFILEELNNPKKYLKIMQNEQKI